MTAWACMIVLAEADRAQDRLSAAQVEAIVEGTDDVLDFLAADMAEGRPLTAPATDPSDREIQAAFHCVGGRGQVDDAAAAIVAFALRQSGLEASSQRRGGPPASDAKGGTLAIRLICYASHPSDAVRRYTLRKLTPGGGAGQARHLVIDYEVAPAPVVDRWRGGSRRHLRWRSRLAMPARRATCRDRGLPRGIGGSWDDFKLKGRRPWKRRGWNADWPRFLRRTWPGYSRLMEADEEETLATLSGHRRIIDEAIMRPPGPHRRDRRRQRARRIRERARCSARRRGDF